MKPIRVHIIYEHGPDRKPFGVAYIRDILPLTHPLNAQAFEVTWSTAYQPAEVLIVERGWKPDLTLHHAERLIEQARADGARLVYTIDDNLLDLESLPLPKRMAMRLFCRLADGILVSTPALQTRLSALSRRIYVLPNMLDERLFLQDGQRPPIRQVSLAEANPQAPIRLGFMGTFTHDADLMLILQTLRQTLRKHAPRVEFQLLGGIANPNLAQAFQGLPFRWLRLEPRHVAYPNFIPWMRQNLRWDLGLAPLEDTPFNRCKSDIKFLDYSALGIPGIYSRLPAYEATLQHLQTGWLAENTPAAWSEALETLLNDPDLRLRLAQNAQEYVFSQRTLQHRAHLWRQAIQEILSSG